jgi:hypothetical protein
MGDASLADREGRRRRLGPAAFVAIALGLALSIARAVLWSRGELSAEAVGYATGTPVLPVVISWAIFGRRKAWNPNLLSFCFCGLCLVLFLLDVKAYPASPKAPVAEPVRETTGAKAPAASDALGHSAVTALVTSILQDGLKMTREHDAESERFSETLDQLYAADSFSSPARMRRCLDAVNGSYAVDREFDKRSARWLEQVRERVNGAKMTETEKQKFLKGFDKSIGNPMMRNTREEIMASEEEWVNAALDLFGYALEHADKLSVKGQAVLISDGPVKAQFARKLRDSQERFDTLQAQRALLLELQKGIMGRLSTR